MDKINYLHVLKNGQFKEIWVRNDDDEQMMSALINGEYGWLMYLREEGDTGFSSRNPDYSGDQNATMKFCFENGEIDEYPMSWVLPVDVVYRALEYFEKYHERPEFIVWHDDSLK